MLEEAEYFESWIQGFRRRRLAELFGHEEELLFCADDVHSQQNRCLVSGERLAPRSAPADAMDQDDDEAATPGPGLSAPVELAAPFFALLERQLLMRRQCSEGQAEVGVLGLGRVGFDLRVLLRRRWSRWCWRPLLRCRRPRRRPSLRGDLQSRACGLT